MKRKPDAALIKGVIYLNKDNLVKELKRLRTAMVKDYKKRRADYLQELMDYSENVNIRLEEDFTRACAKKITETMNNTIKIIELSVKASYGREETKGPSRRAK